MNEHTHWLPVALSADMDAAPHAVQLLGQALVLWRDRQGRLAGAHDRCPHRGARPPA